MIIEDIMTRKAITVSPEDTVMDTLKLARINRIRHIPIVEGRILKGIVSDRDLRDVSPSILASQDADVLANTPVKDIMTTDIITVSPSDPVEEAGRLLFKHRIGCLPVVKEDNQLVGIVTDGDVLFCFVEMYHI